MAKSDLLKEAIADAKAVKETALANAKIALQEAFQPRIKSMLETELMSELEDDELMDEPIGDEMGDDMGDEPMDDIGAEGEPMDVGDIEIDTDMDGEIDFTGDIMSKSGMEDDMGDVEAEPLDVDADMGDMGDMGEPDMSADDDLDLDEIIRELEEDLDVNEMYETDEVEEDMHEQVKDDAGDDGDGFIPESTDKSIDDLIEAILAEEEDEEKEEKVDEMAHGDKEKADKEKEEMKEELQEAYDTVSHLKSVINEVNLLNAKLLYTNKLFRNFELNESQKMKVIENFDRAANTREAKLVFSTLAESFQKPKAGKKIVKESKSLASKAVSSTAPSKETTQVLTEGFEQANRWKKLAGLIK